MELTSAPVKTSERGLCSMAEGKIPKFEIGNSKFGWIDRRPALDMVFQ
jgi:hypothetical protein